jgi:beta-lactamase class D
VARDLGAFFPGFRSTLVLRDVAAGRTVRHDPALARRRAAPCSNFKIPNSLIGLETGVIPDASFVLAWDGVQRSRQEWNRDHDLRSALKDSVVWYYQELARRVGPDRMQKWVSAFHYGNEDLSGGIDRFWLGSSLRLSPDEQVDFLGRLHTGGLSVSTRSVAIVMDILLQDPPGPGIVYRGKTGSCQDPGAPQPHGWWVGSVEKEGGLLLYAARIEGPGASGMVCRPMAEKALAALGVLPPR